MNLTWHVLAAFAQHVLAPLALVIAIWCLGVWLSKSGAPTPPHRRFR